VGDAPLALLDLAPVAVLGKTAIEVRRALERDFRVRLPGRSVPPIRVSRPHRNLDAQAEVTWLLLAAQDGSTL
jgi:hypothetical protein